MAFRITQGDTSPSLLSTLRGDETAVDLSGINDVRFIMENKYEEVEVEEDLSGSVNIIDPDRGEVEYIFSSGETDQVGTYKAEWEVEYGNGAVETFPTGNKIEVEVVEEVG